MTSTIKKRKNKALAYGLVGLLGLIVTYRLLDNYVLNAPRPPFAGAEIDPAAVGTPLEEPPQAGAIVTPPPPTNGATETMR